MSELASGGTLGFIGVGVMGEPMCRHLAVKSGARVSALDRAPDPLRRLADAGVRAATGIGDVAAGARVVFLSLPSGESVREVAEAPGGLLEQVRAGQLVVDLGTSPVDLTRTLARRFAERGATFVDAPVARTRAAAEAGTLSLMVGAEPPVFESIRPLLATFASEITLCGPVGCGQIVKILNNLVLFETVVALSEARAIGERAGVDPALLYDTLSKGSADSFALRNHGMKAILPGVFPERAFSVEYALKDLGYALALAEAHQVDAGGGHRARALLERARAAGFGDRYFPVLSRVLAESRAAHAAAANDAATDPTERPT